MSIYPLFSLIKRYTREPLWKVGLAFVSLVFAFLVWFVGLQDSLSRVSVTPTISMQQQEMAVLADQAVPEVIRPLLVGEDPIMVLKKALEEIPLSQINDRQRLILAGLEPSRELRREILSPSLGSPSLINLQQALLVSNQTKGLSQANREVLGAFREDPLLQRVGCLGLGGDSNECVNPNLAKSIALRLFLIVVLPGLALIAGSGLLLRNIWMFLRNCLDPLPLLQALPLSLTDMVLLVACGFVVLGEVVLPVFVAPLSELVTRGMSSPLSKAVKVLIGYGALALPALWILRQQLRSLEGIDRPAGGWLQWRFQPWSAAVRQAGRGWLMVMPLVLMTGWLMRFLLGDQGGSNPLLEMVLRSHDPVALIVLATTAIIFAPLFEEVVFRGALLPVLAKSFGSGWGVFTSALVFGIAHLSVAELPPLFVLGLGLGLLRLSSGRLFPCVLMHALWNGVTFINLLLLGA